MAESEAESLYPERAIAAEAIEAGRRLFAREARFVAGAADASAGAQPTDASVDAVM